MTAPTIPLSPADHLALAAVVRERWPEAALALGVDPERVNVFPGLGDCLLIAETGSDRDGWENVDPSDLAVGLALSHLGDILADLGYAVAWEGGVRVTGLAAARALLVLDESDPARNMYGAPPCPKCGSVYMWTPNLSKTGGKLRARCDDCGHEEDAEYSEDAAPTLIPLASLDPWDLRRRAHDEALARARAARRGPGPAVDAKREGALGRWRATYGGRR